MTLDELLIYIGAEYLDDRTELLAGDPDELWSDDTLVRYLNEGQRIFCRRSWVLIDTGNVDAGIITLEEGITVYDLHKSVLRVIKATPSDSEFPLARVSEDTLDLRRPVDPDAAFDINSTDTTTPGRPTAISTDVGTRQLRVYPPPSAVEDGLEINLKIARLPIKNLTLDDTEAEPEIPEEWHMSLAKYAAGKCLTHPTVDSEGRADGRALLAEFNDDVHLARQERQRAEMSPGRVVHASSTAYV